MEKGKLTKLEKIIEEEIIEEKNLRSMELFNKLFIELSIEEVFRLEEYIKDINNPIWKPIVINNKETHYLISNTGLVKNNKTGRILSAGVGDVGYLIVVICIKEGRYTRKVHRLVAETFIPNPENKPEVNHKNGSKKINWYLNLEWATYKENSQHAVDTGLINTKGINHTQSKYTDEQIHEVCKLLEKRISYAKISKLLSINISLPNNIRGAGKWSHISSQYNIPEVKKRNIKPLILSGISPA